MTKADKSRSLYALTLVAICGVSFVVGWYFDFRPQALVGIGIVLLIPGRIPTFMWSDFYKGQRALQAGDHKQAEASFQIFLAKLRARPWLKHLIYFKWGVYTWDIEAMTLNNLGNSFVERGEPEQAVPWYEKAIALDEEYGVPYANLAVINYARGDEAAASRLLDRAHALGNRHMTHAVATARGAALRSIANSAR